MPHQMFIDIHKNCVKVRGKGIETNKLTHHHNHEMHHHEEQHMKHPDHQKVEVNNPHMHEEHLHRHLSSLHLGSKNKRITLKF